MVTFKVCFTRVGCITDASGTFSDKDLAEKCREKLPKKDARSKRERQCQFK